MNTPAVTNTTVLSPLAMLFCMLMAGLLLVSRRRNAFLPVVLIVCYMTLGSRIVIFGQNFTMLRILLLAGWLRLICRSELARVQWSTVDTIVVLWVIVRTINYTLLFGTVAALSNRLGYAYDILGTYFFCRAILTESEDVYRAIRYVALLLAPVALLMIVEKLTAHNAFAIFGGVPPTPEIRDGVLRCQGPFAHPILAGTFGATNIALFASLLWRRPANRTAAYIGIFSGLVMTATAGSSGPALAVIAGAFGLALWRMRDRMTLVLAGFGAILLALQVAMNAPIWFVMARLTVFSGSTGWFRGFLIDMAVRHLDEWWLIGSTNPMKWHPFLMDVTNQYLVEGFSGGLFAMLLFIGMLAISFRTVGSAVGSKRFEISTKRLLWALGSALFAHAITFVSVSYFDQNVVMFYFTIAAIPVVATSKSVMHVRPAVFRPISKSLLRQPSVKLG